MGEQRARSTDDARSWDRCFISTISMLDDFPDTSQFQTKFVVNNIDNEFMLPDEIPSNVGMLNRRWSFSTNLG